MYRQRQIEIKGFPSTPAVPVLWFDNEKLELLCRDEGVRKRGILRMDGFEYYLYPYLRNYLYRMMGKWHECWAMNKKMVRASEMGKVERIINVTNL